MTSNRLAGHTLPGEGRIFGNGVGYPRPVGKVQCSCGDWSPELPSANARKAWHRDHKDKIRKLREVPRG